jgi:hypothetical protein
MTALAILGGAALLMYGLDKAAPHIRHKAAPWGHFGTVHDDVFDDYRRRLSQTRATMERMG